MLAGYPPTLVSNVLQPGYSTFLSCYTTEILLT